MGQPLNNFWRTIEERGCQAELFRWKEMLDSEYDSLKDFLYPTEAKATSYPCPSPGFHGCPRRIREKNGEVIAECSSVQAKWCNSICLPLNDIVIYDINWRKICELAATALGVDFLFKKIPEHIHTYKIGDHIPIGNKRYPIYLSIQRDVQILKTILTRLCNTHNQKPFILVTSTADSIDVDTVEVLGKHGAHVLFLNDMVKKGTDGKFCQIVSPTVLLEDFNNKILPQASANNEIIPFITPPGAKWSDITITFENGEVVIIKCGDTLIRANYSQMGMVNRQNAEPLEQWRLLRVFADNYGVVHSHTRNVANRMKQQKGALSEALRRYFNMEGDPFRWDYKENSYKTRFIIKPEPDAKVPYHPYLDKKEKVKI